MLVVMRWVRGILLASEQVRIGGKLNREGYLKILQDSAIPSGLNFIVPQLIFQLNDPKQSSKLFQTFL